MKKLVLIAGLMIATAMSANAGWSIFGSYWDAKHADDAIGGGIGLHFVTVPIELRGTAYPDVSVRGAGDSLIIPVDLGLAWNLTPNHRVGLTIGAGASYYFIDADVGNPDDEFGWYVLGRAEMPLDGRMHIFADVMHREVEFDDIRADLSGIAVNVGLIFR